MGNSTLVKIADRYIRIHSLYEEVPQLCRDYVVREELLDEGEDILTIQTTAEDIVLERERSAREDSKEGIPVRNFTDSYLETLAVYRQMAEQLLSYDTVLFHGSVIAVDGEGYLFTAKSGTGKSTHTRLWKEYFGERAIMVNDDKPLLKIGQDGVVAYGTPWDGKHRRSNNIAVPLKAICILKRGEKNKIVPVLRKEAYPVLLQQIYRPQSAQQLGRTLQLLDRLLEQTKLYCLHCTMQPEAAQIAYEGMNRE